MIESMHKSTSHAVFSIKLHIVFVTKYRRRVFDPPMLEYAQSVLTDILAAWRCDLLEFGGEADHVHLLIDIHPALNLSTLINNLKTASSRRIRNQYADHLKSIYGSKPVLWHRAYFVASCGGAPLETIKHYVQSQWTG